MQYESASSSGLKVMAKVKVRVVNEYPVNRLTVERTECRLVKLVLGYSVKKYKQNVANIKIRSVWLFVLFVLRDGTLFWQVINNYRMPRGIIDRLFARGTE